MPTMSRVCFYLSLSVAAAASVSCKLKKTDGTVKTLENLAAGNQDKQNKCSGEFASDTFDAAIDVSAVDPKDRSAMKARVKSALSAVPPGFQKAYFTYAKGTVRVTPNAEKECSNLLTSNATKSSVAETFISCADDSNNKVTLIVKAEAGAIDHNIVRIMATLINGWSAVGEKAGTKTEASLFAKDLGAYIRAWQLYLTSAFIADLKSMPKAAKTLKIFEDVRKENDVKKKARLQEELFANMFDSVYCSDLTRQSLSELPKTLNEIRQMINDPLTVKQDGASRAAQISWSYLADTKKSPILPTIEVKKGSGLNLGDRGFEDPLIEGPRTKEESERFTSFSDAGIENWNYNYGRSLNFVHNNKPYIAERNVLVHSDPSRTRHIVKVYPSQGAAETYEDQEGVKEATWAIQSTNTFSRPGLNIYPSSSRFSIDNLNEGWWEQQRDDSTSGSSTGKVHEAG
jgi:hypothetical protein